MSQQSQVPEALSVDIFRQTYHYKPPEAVPVIKRLRMKLSCSAKVLANVFPILQWIPQYNIRRDIIGDLIAGLTVAVMHIPHGLAYAPLAGQAPVAGLYMAVFPAVMYLFLGTSKHISLGTFAVVCMMVGKTVSEVASPEGILSNNTLSNETIRYSSLEVGVAVCFISGIWQFLFGMLHLGSLWVLLSDSLVSGFTTGAAIHVVTYQIKNLLGVKASSFSGPLKLVYTVIDLIEKVPQTNLVTLGLSCCSICILSIFNEFIKPIIQRKFPKFRVPVPIELIVIILGILVSYFLNLESDYHVHTVHNVPTGLPSPIVPPLELFPNLAVDCFVIGVVAISMSLSLASIFARKSGYEINGNQELIAYGACNMFSAFFHCIPCSASLSRSLVQHSVGGKSQIASVFTLLTIVLILLFLGPCFEPVPYGVLSSIVVVTLKGLLWQIKDFPGIWKQNKLDGTVWLVTVICVVFIDLDYGLGIGLAMSVLTLVLRGQTLHVSQLGKIPETNLFLDANCYGNVDMSSNVLFLKIVGAIHFANASTFHEKVFKHFVDFKLINKAYSERLNKSVVLDFSCVPSVDPTGINNLVALSKDLKDNNCQLFLTDMYGSVYDFLDQCDFFNKFPKNNVIHSTFDAAEFLIENKSN